MHESWNCNPPPWDQCCFFLLTKMASLIPLSNYSLCLQPGHNVIPGVVQLAQLPCIGVLLMHGTTLAHAKNKTLWFNLTWPDYLWSFQRKLYDDPSPPFYFFLLHTMCFKRQSTLPAFNNKEVFVVEAPFVHQLLKHIYLYLIKGFTLNRHTCWQVKQVTWIQKPQNRRLGTLASCLDSKRNCISY